MIELSLKSLLKKRAFSEFEQFQKFALLKNKDVILAGGIFRKFINPEEKVMDFDLFFRTQDALDETKEKIVRQGAETIFSCPEGKLFTYIMNGLKVQCIKERLVSNPIDLLENFDINACRFALADGVIVTDKTAIKDVKNKHITFHKISYPIATFRRVIKYQNKGYSSSEIDAYCNFIWQLGMQGIPYSDTVYID